MTTGRRLHRWASRLVSARTMEQLIDPMIADLQHEHERAKATGHLLRTGIVLLRGYAVFWKLFAVHVPAIWLQRRISEFCASHLEWLRRAVVPAVIAMAISNASLIVEPARGINQSGLVGTWLVILLLPQSIPFSIPLSIFTGIVWGLRGRPVTRQIRRLVVIVGLAGTLASASTMIWAVPIANQAFRTVIARRVPLKGLSEMSPREIREYALVLRNEGRTAKAGHALMSYHARWALAGAALVFAIFGLGVTALRVGRIATVLIAATALVVYVTYFAELGEVRLALFSHEALAMTFAWLPNLFLLLTSIAFLLKRDDRRLPAN